MLVLYPVFKSISQLKRESLYASFILITSFVSATLPAIPTPKGIIISSAFARSTASSSALD